MPEDLPDFEALQAFAERGDDVDRGLLRHALAKSLVLRGFAGIVSVDDDSDSPRNPEILPTAVTLVILWSLGTAAARAVGLEWYLWPVGVVVVFLALGLLIQLWKEASQVLGALLIIGWVVVGVLEAEEGISALVATYIAPLGLAIAYAFATRTLRLREAQDFALAIGGVVRGAPLVAPVVLIVLFIPSLSRDVWEVAGALTPEGLLIVGGLTVGLLVFVVNHQLASDLESVLAQRAKRLCDAGGRAALTREQGTSALGKSDELPFLEGLGDESIERAWPDAGEEYTPFVYGATRNPLRRPLVGRLAITTIAVGLLLTAYIFALCSFVVPVSVASEWSQTTVPSTDVHAFGLDIVLHGGPYLKLAALFGLVATATFLAFAVVEERFATALTDALLREPIDRFLVLALPYLNLREQVLGAVSSLNPGQGLEAAPTGDAPTGPDS
jgi:hypothetical protein